MSSTSLSKGRGHHRSRGGVASSSQLTVGSTGGKKGWNGASVSHTSIPPSHSEEASSEDSDSDTSYVDSNDSDEDGSGPKSGHCSIPPPTSSRMKVRGKLVTPVKQNVCKHVTCTVTCHMYVM